MSETVTRTDGVGTWVGASKPDSNHVEDNLLRLRATDRVGLLRLPSPVPVEQGAVVVEAALVLTTKTAAAASTFTVTGLDAGIASRKVTWNNRPTATGLVSTATPGALAAGDTFEVDVTTYIQSVADGARNFGWQIETDSVDAVNLFGVRAATGRPVLRVTYSLTPGTPTDLVPADGAVSVASPVLGFTASYPDAADAMTAFEVEIADSTDPDFTAPISSGWVAATEPVIDLAVVQVGGITITLGPGDDYLWRVRTQSSSGGVSDWSPDGRLFYIAKGALAVTSPVGLTVSDWTPVISWSLTGATQTAWRVIVTDPATGEVVADSDRTSGTATTWEVPDLALDGPGPYGFEIRVWDDQDREATPGDPVYTTASGVFTVAATGGVAPVDTIAAAGAGPNRPAVVVSWTRGGSVPDGFTVVRDGRPVSPRLLPEDVSTAPGVFEWVDVSGSTGNTYTYTVVVENDGSTSNVNPEVVFTGPGTSGVWLGDPDGDVWVRLSASNVDGLGSVDSATLFEPAGARAPIRWVAAVRGLSGPIGGVLVDTAEGYSAEAGRAAALAIKAAPAKRYRLVAGDLDCLVIVGDVTVKAHPETSVENRMWVFSANVWQVNRFGFRVPRGLRR